MTTTWNQCTLQDLICTEQRELLEHNEEFQLKEMDRSPSRSSCSASCVKLYLCSNPEDSAVEHRVLQEDVFPRLREFCRHKQGLDVRLVDPYESSDPARWPDEYSRQQLITECRETSAGPFLLALVGHQYGTGSLPAQVEVSEFQQLLQEGQQASLHTQELEKVYLRDENTVPPSYCLRLLHRHNSCSQEDEERNMKNRNQQLVVLFQSAVSLCVDRGVMNPQRARFYHTSALDADLRFALQNRPHNDIIRRCLVYVHKVINPTSERYKEKMTSRLQLDHLSEITAFDHINNTALTAGQLMSDLCDIFLPGLIASCQLPVYSTTTVCDRRCGYTAGRRRCYAQSLGQQVYTDLVGLIDSSVIPETEGSVVASGGSCLGCTLARERCEQEELCATLSHFYDVILPEEQKVRAYVQHKDKHCPLVVTGGPCRGKTVLLARCSQQMKSWMDDSDPVVITYFSNLSVDPSPKHLLSSLCYQIAGAYHTCFSMQDHNLSISPDLNHPSCILNPFYFDSSCIPPSNLSPHYETKTRGQLSFSNQRLIFDFWLNPNSCFKPDISLFDLKEHLSSLLCLLPSPKKPLVLILNGLDQIENNHSLQIIGALPSPLPPSVKLILSISSNRMHALQAIKLHYPQCSGTGYECVQLGSVDRRERGKMLASLLSVSGRRITSGQQALVNQALTSCSLPLYTCLLHVQTSLLHSDSEVTAASLPDGVHSSISALLDHLEQKYNSHLLGRAVSYLTLSRNGLTEGELADLLSADDDVLAEYVCRGEEPDSKTRVPQVDVERLLLDLRNFLIRRTVAGSQVLFWVSRHFKLVVGKRYLLTGEVGRGIYSQMADYFGARTLFLDQKPDPNSGGAQVEMHMDRPSSRRTFDSTSSKEVVQLNCRREMELLHHLQESNRWEELEHSLIRSLELHQAMVQAGLLEDLVALLQREENASKFFLKERGLLANILRSSTCLLHSFPLQLPTVMESALLPYLGVFPALEDYVKKIQWERRKSCKGIGLVLCPASSNVPPIHCLQRDANTRNVLVTDAAGTECGVVIEVLDDGSAWIWKSPSCGLAKLSLSCEQNELQFAGVKTSERFVLFVTRSNKLFFWDVMGPEILLEIKDPLKTEEDPEEDTTSNIEGFVVHQQTLCLWQRGERFVSMFDTSSSQMLSSFECGSSVTCLVYSSDGAYICCGQEDGTVSKFDTSTSSLIGTSSVSNHSAIIAIILCENKQEMTSVDQTGTLRLWDVSSENQLPTLVKQSPTVTDTNTIISTDYADQIHTLLVCAPKQVALWDTCEWELLDQFLAPPGTVFTQAVLSHVGHLILALLDTCPLVMVWRVSSGNCVPSLETGTSTQPLMLLKTATDVICVTQNGSLTVWDSEMIHVAGTLPKMKSGVKEVVVELTGELFYTADGSETVWSWSVETGLPHASFLHDGPVEKLRLSPDSIHLVTLSGEDIYTWQTETGQNLLRIHGSRASDILLTPNNKFGVSVSERGLTRVWKLVHGDVVCSIHLYLSDAQVSPESTFLLGCCHGDLLAASLWSGSINKRFSCPENSENVIAFHPLSGHPDFVVAMADSGAVYTWNVAEETACRHFQLPYMFRCQLLDFQMSSDGSYALLSTDNDAITILDLSVGRLCLFRTNGPITKSCLDKTGHYAAYISRHSSVWPGCACHLHTKTVLTVLRLADGERLGSVILSKNPLTLVVCEQQSVFVSFDDGSVGVYSISDAKNSVGESVSRTERLNHQMKQCPCDTVPFTWLPLTTYNVIWL
ncbi:NACHT and WD repeat domain-containing protein 2-like [Thalassophryne amazonica]|uniref:NACHT and WD repeat domain-containing protein 2-like n=1 Tax=Thalassophryne amazonica TaxID=390379 RepID=UPI00147192A7|nr:NACHT and WD repeat domain-containing protein 2-like [Thalassophryne amazonica]